MSDLARAETQRVGSTSFSARPRKDHVKRASNVTAHHSDFLNRGFGMGTPSQLVLERPLLHKVDSATQACWLIREGVLILCMCFQSVLSQRYNVLPM